MKKAALLIVDVQNDFCPGGALGVEGGDEVVPVINLLAGQFDLVFASKDWHPENTVHFEKWPPHCIRATQGAEFHPELDISKIHYPLLKGTGDTDDGYSAFESTNYDLNYLLHLHKIHTLYIAGLTTEYCIKNSAIDARKFRFETIVVENAIRPVNKEPGDEEKAWSEMERHGVGRIHSNDLVTALT